MVGRLHVLGVRTSQNIEASIAFNLKVLGAHHSSGHGIFVDLFKLLSSGVVLVLLVNQVKGGSRLILFAGVISLNFCLQSFFLILVVGRQLLKPLHLTVKSFLAQIGKFVLLLIELLCTDSLVSNSEVLVEALAF